jgi:hypothetical protein
MAVPVAHATVSGFHTTTIPYTSLPFTLPLMGTATNPAITEWEWVCVPSGVDNRGSTPYGSFLPSGIVGTWTNGVNKNQNPTALLDEPGGYCFSLRARNADGWSDPSYDGDGHLSQAITFVLTPEDIKLPAAQQYDYDRDLNETLNVLASGLHLQGKDVSTTLPTLSGQVLTWNPAQAEYKPQIPFTNEFLGKPLASQHPTISGQLIAWQGSSWAPQRSFPDTDTPMTTYVSATTLTIAPTPRTNGPARITLQDNIQRVLPGTLTWAFTNGVAELGLDTGSEASSTWYFLYCVPKASDSNQLTIRASVTPPPTGPTGYTLWKYIGAFRNDGSSNILPVFQTGTAEFQYANPVLMINSGGFDGSPVQLLLATYIPVTSRSVILDSFLQPTTSYGSINWWIVGYTSGVAFASSFGPTNYSGQFSKFEIPTPSAIKQVYYQRVGGAGINQQSHHANGWIDQYL